MKTKAQFLFDSGVFQESKLEEDKTAIVAYYTDRGFVDAKIDNVTRTVQTQQGRNYLVLTIYITEGEQWIYGGMTFTGNTVFPTRPAHRPGLPEAGQGPEPPEGAGGHLAGSGLSTTTTATSSTRSPRARPGTPRRRPSPIR